MGERILLNSLLRDVDWCFYEPSVLLSPVAGSRVPEASPGHRVTLCGQEHRGDGSWRGLLPQLRGAAGGRGAVVCKIIRRADATHQFFLSPCSKFTGSLGVCFSCFSFVTVPLENTRLFSLRTDARST